MYFEIKDTEMDLIQKTALEEDISLDGALRKLLFLGRDIKRDEDVDLPSRTEVLEGIISRTDNLKEVMKIVDQVLTETIEEYKKML